MRTEGKKIYGMFITQKETLGHTSSAYIHAGIQGIPLMLIL